VAGAQEHTRAWMRDIDTLVNRLRTLDDQLGRQLRDLTERLLAPARVSGLALVDRSYLEHLFGTYKPAVSATTAELLEGNQRLHDWTGWSQEAVRQAVVGVALQPFEPIRQISVERVIQDRSDQMTARQWVDMLVQKAKPAWNLNEVLLPRGAAHLARIELLGVPDRERSIYANKAARLVSTSDPHRITAFTMTAGAPVTALRSYRDYRRIYEQVRGKRPLHVLPEFLAEGQSARLAFALAHLFGFIIDRGVYYYYQPVDKLTELVKLGRGKGNAIETLGGHEGLVGEVMERVEARIEDVGYDQVRQELAAFYEATGDEDDLTRELKRLVRGYADQLGKRRLV
ncbi:MAG: hypothetical protein ACE5LU_25735, partial [Anaerolineae bacterium]